MASRITNKINRQALQNICKSLYSGSTESSGYPRSNSNDATTAASTITTTSSTINNSSNSNVSPLSNMGFVPPTTPISSSPLSLSSVQTSTYHNHNQVPNTPVTIGTDDFAAQDLSTGNILTKSTSGSSQMPSLSMAYQVCPLRPRTSPNFLFDNNQFNAVSHKKPSSAEKKPLQTNYLQPAKQPNYYVAEKEDHNTPRANAEALKEAVAKGSMHIFKEPSASDTNGGYRKFEESMTYRSLTQPFKFSRLASPFPEPVKEMASHKISDKEKAAQMFAESRNNAMAQAHFEQRQKQLRLKPQVPLQPNLVRHYSMESSGRKKKDKCEVEIKKKKCRKYKTERTCPPVNKSTSCQHNTYIFKKCTKKEAPYASYSESVQDVDLYQSCKICPWMDEIHPALKPKKRSYHTHARSMSTDAMSSEAGTSMEANSSGGSSHDVSVTQANRSVDGEGSGSGSAPAMDLKKRDKRKNPECKPNPELNKVPCAWVELDRQEELANRPLPKRNTGPPCEPKKKKVLTQETAPCEPTSQRRCPPNDSTTNFPAGKQKRRSTSTPRKRQPKDKRCATIPSVTAPDLFAYEGEAETSSDSSFSHIPRDVATPVGQSIDQWLAGLRPDQTETRPNVLTMEAGGSCQKFPFKKSSFNLVINRKAKGIPSKCPKKNKKPLFEDCPPRTCPGRKKGECLAGLVEEVLECKKKKQDESKKCPKPKALDCEDVAEPNLENPCKGRHKKKSEICPTDLLPKKKKINPCKKTKGSEESFGEAIAMLESIQQTRSVPSLSKSCTLNTQ